MTTPIYHLPYPLGAEQPAGADQIRQLAVAMDGALTDVQTRPNPIWGRFSIIASDVAYPDTPWLGFTIAAQRGGFTLADPNRIVIPVAGTYWLSAAVRGRSIAGTGNVNSWGYTMVTVYVPEGTTRWDFLRNQDGAGWTDTPTSGLLTNLPAGARLLMRLTNATGVTHTQSGRVQLHRVGGPT